jgi:hypothetical protein
MDEKRAFVAAHSDAWPTSSSRWELVRAGTAKARSIAPLVAGALLTAEIPTTPGFLDLDVATLSATFRFANRIRARYTVIDFLEGQGLLNEAVASVMAEVPIDYHRSQWLNVGAKRHAQKRHVGNCFECDRALERLVGILAPGEWPMARDECGGKVFDAVFIDDFL